MQAELITQFPPPHKHINPRVNERGLNILFHGSHEMTASSSATPCARRHTLKLAINTHVAYQRPLATLFESLVGTGFLSFADVLVLMGGAPHEEPPHMEMLVTLLVARGPSAPLATASVVVARTRANAFDYHGLALLARHHSHPLIAADNYLYVHDTVTFDSKQFMERFESFRLPRSPFMFTTWPLPNSNVAVLGAQLVRAFGRNFDGNVSKRDAFTCEFGYPLQRDGHPTMRPLHDFGLVIKMGPRVVNGTLDVYATGLPRIRFWYPAFGVYKFSLRSDAAGDLLHGKTEKLFAGRRWKPPQGAELATVRFGPRPTCWARPFCHDQSLSLRGYPHPLSLPVCETRYRDV